MLKHHVGECQASLAEWIAHRNMLKDAARRPPALAPLAMLGISAPKPFAEWPAALGEKAAALAEAVRAAHSFPANMGAAVRIADSICDSFADLAASRARASWRKLVSEAVAGSAAAAHAFIRRWASEVPPAPTWDDALSALESEREHCKGIWSSDPCPPPQGP